MTRLTLIAAVAVLAFACGTDEPVDVAAIETSLDRYLDDRDGHLGLYVHGLEAGAGSRVRVITQLDESQTAEAETLCNLAAVSATENGIDLMGVDVAAAGGRFIAACRQKG